MPADALTNAQLEYATRDAVTTLDLELSWSLNGVFRSSARQVSETFPRDLEAVAANVTVNFVIHHIIDCRL